jgi:DNA-directed RNA polymerase specialized sigma24 family protein
MYTTSGMTEDEVLAVIECVVRQLASKFTVPGFDRDDIAQEARLMAMDGLHRYEPQPDASGRPTRPLMNFLVSHVRNRLVNLRRDRHRRADSPCRRCQNGAPCGPDGGSCDAYLAWNERQQKKSFVRNPVGLDSVSEENASTGRDSTVEEASHREMLRMIDEGLPVELRRTYLQMRAGVPNVSRSKREQVEVAVREILGASLP